jgi:hypothetical protein
MSDLKFQTIDICKRDGQLFVRCPIDLKSLISKSAERSARSLAAEVTLRLMRSLEDYEFISNLSDIRQGG